MRATFWPSIFPLPFIKFPKKLSKLARLLHSRFFFSQVSSLKKTRAEFGRKHFLLFREMLLSSFCFIQSFLKKTCQNYNECQLEMIKLFNSLVLIRNYMLQLYCQTRAIKFILLMSLDNIIIYNSHVFYYFALTEAIKKLRTVSKADLTAVPLFTASSTRTEFRCMVIDMNKPNIPSSPG